MQVLLGGATLSPELESAAAHRLGALALVVAAVSALLGCLDPLIGMQSVMGVSLRVSMLAVAVLISLGLYGMIARGHVPPQRALQLGLVYQIVQAFLMAVAFHSITLAPGAVFRGWTSVAVWTLLYPLIVPASPRQVVLGTLASAAMDPLGLWLSVVAGASAPPPAVLAQVFLPTAIAAGITPIAARIVYGLTVEVKRAREMGSYRLLEKLGEGGMGEVWRAEHRLLARAAAIKLIRPAALGGRSAASAREAVKRFEREARATAALRSPHTIAVYDYGVAADGTFHYVMELLLGFSLQALVERFGPLPPERVVALLLQACHSLAEAHAAGLVHRDVKPANLFVARLGQDVDFVKVLDFGLVKARQGGALGDEALTVAGAFTGTPSYMPPEMALGQEPIDGRADIYALGCVAYWLLVGQRVFEGKSAMQMMIDHVRTPPMPPSLRAKQPIPPALERLVLRCLEKEPERRPVSVLELSRELRALGLEERWSEARARVWWSEHAPERALEQTADYTRTMLGAA
jgi:serine/threonine-protein kinase